jgi:hypothetical protein
MRYTDLEIGSCFLDRRGKTRKKVADHRTSIVREDNGRVSTRKQKGDPTVDSVTCPLRFLAVGLRRHPDQVVEMGHGNILKRRPR